MISAAPIGAAAAASSALPWVEKYRPKSLADVASQTNVVSILTACVAGHSPLPHLLFFGPPGTGKTSCAHALCRALFSPDTLAERVLELNASDERGIQVVRDRIRTFAKASCSGLFKVIILDEADALTADAQTALRRVIEQYAATTRFILLCNQVSRIIEPLTSRCAKIRFAPIPVADAVARLQTVCKAEGLPVPDSALRHIMQVSGGDLRAAINLLQSVCICAGAQVSDAVVDEVAGVVPDSIVQTVYDAVKAAAPVGQLYELVNRLVVRQSYSPRAVALAVLNRFVNDSSSATDEQQKARVLVYAGEVDARTGSEVLHLMALLGQLQSAFDK